MKFFNIFMTSAVAVAQSASECFTCHAKQRILRSSRAVSIFLNQRGVPLLNSNKLKNSVNIHKI